MNTSQMRRSILAVGLALASGACATSPNVFEQHQGAMAQRSLAEASADRMDCPVVVANSTDQHLDVEYRAGGLRNGLGILPAGQRTSFQVPCTLETVRAFGTVALEGLDTEHREFETRGRLDNTKVAVLHFTEMHAVR